MNETAVYGLLGICRKAGRLLSGDRQVKDGLGKKTGCLLLIAADSSEESRRSYVNMAERAQISWEIFGNKEELGHALGKGPRTAVLITDPGFGKTISQKLKSGLCCRR
ncbi:MAG TPA: 50S ribosomal protein L7 [Veillonellaceae bacterium]|jgi:ribosomal protein L7Ae-like RNA K-turn-binding protein|nr:50S ribosomal protein L7 [Veillonellaceae bacterium]